MAVDHIYLSINVYIFRPFQKLIEVKKIDIDRGDRYFLIARLNCSTWFPCPFFLSQSLICNDRELKRFKFFSKVSQEVFKEKAIQCL